MRRTQATLYEARATVASALQRLISIGRNGDDKTRAEVIAAISKLKIDVATHDAPEIEDLPDGNDLFDYQVPASQPAQPQSPQPAQAAQPAEPVEPAQAAQAAQPADPNVATAGPAHETIAELNALVRQPQIDRKQFMQTILNGLKQTQQGTPERQQMVLVINHLQSNSVLTTKVPELKQIAIQESWLREADPNTAPVEELSRSQIDAIFISVAQHLMELGYFSNLASADDDNADDSDDNDAEQEVELDRYYDKIITSENMHYVIHDRHFDRATEAQMKVMLDLIDKHKHLSLRQLLRRIKQVPESNYRTEDDLLPDVRAALIRAAQAWR